MTSMNMRSIAVAFAVGCVLAVAGCAGEKPQSQTTPGLDTGITSSSGGSMPNVHTGITAPVKP